MNRVETKDYLDQMRICFSDDIESVLVSIEEETRKKVGRSWSNPTAKMSDNSVTYRFVNYLDEKGLVADHRTNGKKGWRRFSYVDIIYLELAVALRRIGIKSDILEHIYRVFSAPYEDSKALYRGIDWLDILLAVHCGIEIELLISPGNKCPIFCDPGMAFLFGTHATEGQIRISLSSIVNRVRTMASLAPIKIVYNLSSGGLNNGEMEAVFAIRGLNGEEEEVKIRKTAKDRMLINVKRPNRDKAFKEDLEALIRKHNVKDFTDLSLSFRQGGIAYVKETDSNIY